MNNMHFINIVIFINLIATLLYANNCEYFKIKYDIFSSPLKNYLQKYDNTDSLLSVAERELVKLDEIPISYKKNKCNELKLTFKEKLIQRIIIKIKKNSLIDNKVRSNKILSLMELNHYEKLLKMDVDDTVSLNHKIAIRIKNMGNALNHLSKATAYLDENIKHIADSSTICALLDIEIKKAEIYIFIGCVFELPAQHKEKQRYHQLYEESDRYYAVLNEKAIEGIDNAIGILNTAKKAYLKYQYINSTCFNEVDNKIVEYKLLINDIVDRNAIGNNVLNP